MSHEFRFCAPGGDQMVTMGLYYDNLAAPIGNRVLNVVVPQQYGSQYTWSAHLWDRRT